MKLLFFLLSPIMLVKKNVDLFLQILVREIQIKYKGSYLGLLWNFINPLFSLMVYTFVFGVVFRARWDFQMSDNKAEFAITLFAGIIVFSFFSEALNRSTTLIHNNTNYVKKVIFPLELLSVANVVSILVQMLFNVIIIITVKLLALGRFDFYFLFLPFVVVPLIEYTLGLSWIISGISVFVKDTSQVVSIVVLMLGYLTPVFYLISLVPSRFRWGLYLNPLTVMVNMMRDVMIYGKIPDIKQLLIIIIIMYFVMLGGFVFFRKVKTEFSDVL